MEQFAYGVHFSRAAWRKTDIVCKGKCSQKGCEATVEAVLSHRTNNLLICIEKFEPSVLHDSKKKRRLQQNEKEELKVMLRGKSTFALRNELAAGQKFTRTPRLAYIEHTEIDQEQRSVF